MGWGTSRPSYAEGSGARAVAAGPGLRNSDELGLLARGHRCALETGDGGVAVRGAFSGSGCCSSCL